MISAITTENGRQSQSLHGLLSFSRFNLLSCGLTAWGSDEQVDVSCSERFVLMKTRLSTQATSQHSVDAEARSSGLMRFDDCGCDWAVAAPCCRHKTHMPRNSLHSTLYSALPTGVLPD